MPPAPRGPHDHRDGQLVRPAVAIDLHLAVLGTEKDTGEVPSALYRICRSDLGFLACEPGKVPFAQDAAPVVLKITGRAIPDWKLVNNSAGETPKSPVASNEPETKLELIPYGCTRLRITEFPVVK